MHKGSKIAVENGITEELLSSFHLVFLHFSCFSRLTGFFFCHSDRSTAGPRSQSGNPVIHW